jgi:hypothetical protein
MIFALLAFYIWSNKTLGLYMNAEVKMLNKNEMI